MKESFDWKTEEDKVWEVSSDISEKPKSSNNWLRYLLVLGPLLLVAGALIYWQAKDRINDARASRQSDILATYGLIREASLNGDVEILRSLLSGADFQWAVTQQELAEKGWLYDRRFMGLERMTGTLSVVDVTLSPELDSAELTSEETFRVVSGNQLGQEVVLQRTDVFRPGDRWFWSPPKNEFWEGTTGDQISGEYLMVLFPRRDSEIVQRLHSDLEETLRAICNNSDICRDLSMVQISFSRDPSSLIDVRKAFDSSGYLSNLTRLPDGRLSLTLPTPSLVGLPTDDSGYEVIRQGYGSLIIGGVLDETLDDDCCGDRNMRQAAIMATLSRLGLLPWKSGMSLEFQSETYPDQDLELLCSTGIDSSPQVWRYDFTRGTWRMEIQNHHIVSIENLPGDLGIAYLELSPQEGDIILTRVVLWRQEGEITLFEQSFPVKVARNINLFVRERERRLMLEITIPEQGESTIYDFDLRSCGGMGCVPKVYNGQGRPTWSPDGSQLLLRENGTIWQRRGDMAVPISQGVGPFWIDDMTFGYHNRIGGESYIALRSTNEDTEQVVLSTDTLKNNISSSERPDELVIGHVTVDTNQVNRWIILTFSLAMNGTVDEAFLFDFDYQTGEVELIQRGPMLHSYELSSGSSSLATSHYDEDVNSWEIEVYPADLGESETVPVPGGGSIIMPPEYSWTADGRWLVILSQGILSFFHPDSDQFLSINAPTIGCSQAVWTG